MGRLRWLIPLLSLISAPAFAFFFEGRLITVGETYNVNLDEVGPGQTHVGFDEVDELQMKWGQTATDKAREKANKATRAAAKKARDGVFIQWAEQAKGSPERLKTILANYLKENVLDARITPRLNPSDPASYRFRIPDGHHHTTAIEELLYGNFSDLPPPIQQLFRNEQGLADFQRTTHLQARLRVQTVYKTANEAVLAMSRSNMGQFNLEGDELEQFSKIRASTATRYPTAEEMAFLRDIYARLPNNTRGLRDHPFRSAMGKVFDKLNLDTQGFASYIQFKVEEKLKARGIGLPPGRNPMSDEVVDSLIKEIFSNDDTVAVLTSNVKPEMNAQMLKSIERARKIAQKLKPSENVLTGPTAASCSLQYVELAK